jgi:MFS family permease
MVRPTLARLSLDRRPLAVPAFRRLWVASVVAAVGGSFGLVAVPAQLFALAGSGAVGAAGGVLLVTVAGSALASGALADRADRRLVLLGAHAALAATYALLGLHAAGPWRSLGVLLALVACQGVALGAILTVTGAVVPRVVPPDLLAAASSLSSLVRYGGAVAGPLLAGALLPVTGLAVLYLCDAAALLCVLWAVFRLPPLAAPPRRERSGERGAAGFRLLLTDRLLTAVVAVDLAAMVFGFPAALFPELAHREYGGPATGGTALGLLYAAYPAGVCAMALLSGTVSRTRRHGTLMAAAATAWAGCVVLLGLAPGLGTALLALALGGAANLVLSSSRNAITQGCVDDAARGRTQGALTVVLFGGPQLAAAVHGAAGSVLGPRAAVCLGGLLTAVTVAAVWRGVPELRARDPVSGR